MNLRVIARGRRRGSPMCRDRLSLRRRHAAGARGCATGLFRPGDRLGEDADLRPRGDLGGALAAGPAAGRGIRQHDRGPARTAARGRSSGTRSRSSLDRGDDAGETFPGRRIARRDPRTRDPFVLELIKNALVDAGRRDGADGVAHRALLRRQGGARFLDRAVPGRRRADRAGHLPAVPSRRHAVRGARGGRTPSAAASGRAICSSPTTRTTAARTCRTSCWSSRSSTAAR